MYEPVEAGATSAAGHGGGHPWQRWLGIGAAIVLGVIVGVVGTNARHDAIQQREVELVAGQVNHVGGYEDPDGPILLEVSLFNAGARPVEIQHVHIDGWQQPADLEPTTVEPDTWGVLAMSVLADCEAEADSPQAEVVVATESGQRTVPLQIRQQRRAQFDARDWACSESPSVALPHIQIADVEIAQDEPDLDTVLSVDSGGLGGAYLTDLRFNGVGLEAITSDLPAQIESGQPAEFSVLWRVTDCAAAARLHTLQLSVNVAEDPDSGGETNQVVDLPARFQMDVVRFILDSCPD